MSGENFFSYLYGTATAIAFDDVADTVDLSNADSINKAFELYVNENSPPYDLKEAMLDVKFYDSTDDGRNGAERFIRYDLNVPGLDDDFNSDDVKSYLEDFLERIGAENSADSSLVVDVETRPDDRGGVDVDVYVSIGGAQIRPGEG